MEKKKNLIIVILFIIIAILAVLCGLLATGTISFNRDKCKDDGGVVKVDDGTASNIQNYKIDVSVLDEYKNVTDGSYGNIWSSYYDEIVKKEVEVSVDGRVCVRNLNDNYRGECNYLPNVSNVIDAITIWGHPMGAYYYFLQADGTVYNYFIHGNDEPVTKKLNVHNIIRIYAYQYENMVGETAVPIGINSSGETIMLISLCLYNIIRIKNYLNSFSLITYILIGLILL